MGKRVTGHRLHRRDLTPVRTGICSTQQPLSMRCWIGEVDAYAIYMESPLERGGAAGADAFRLVNGKIA